MADQPWALIPVSYPTGLFTGRRAPQGSISYVQLPRLSYRLRWWRPLVTILLGLGLVVLAMVVIVAAFIAIPLIVGPLSRGVADEDPWWVGMTENLSTGLWILAAWAMVHWGLGLRFGYLCSVVGAFRWRIYGVSLLISLIITAFPIVIIMATNDQGYLNLSGPAVAVALVSIFTTPLQAAGEEFIFRGALSQVIGSFFAKSWVSFLVAGTITGILFSLAHAPVSFLQFFMRFVSGFLYSGMVRLTGGIEASSAAHATWNIVLMVTDALYVDATPRISQSPTHADLDQVFIVSTIEDLVIFVIVALAFLLLRNKLRMVSLAVPGQSYDASVERPEIRWVAPINAATYPVLTPDGRPYFSGGRVPGVAENIQEVSGSQGLLDPQNLSYPQNLQNPQNLQYSDGGSHSSSGDIIPRG